MSSRPDGERRSAQEETVATVVETVATVVETITDKRARMAPADGPRLPPRYEDAGRIASGGFGEVRRVFDTALERAVAMKILHAEVAARERPAARFLAEVKLTAGLAHPGIVAVYDAGHLDDGRLWFTMREVRGRTLGEVIDEIHDAASEGDFRETRSGWTFRRLVDAFARACQAVAYAHRRGVVHRDLKPDNIMVGELGDVLVMDWGLGRRCDDADDADDADDTDPAAPAVGTEGMLTQHGEILGTPAYMPPEQALGQRDLHGPASDVYALGAILYHLLSGRPPYRGDAMTMIAKVIAGPPEPVTQAAYPRSVPDELAAACERAMQRVIAARYKDAEALAGDMVAWLDGARRRDQALAVVETARRIEPEIAALRMRAAVVLAEAAARLEGVRSFHPLSATLPGWALEDEAAQLDVEATLREVEWLTALGGALTLDPELPEAHAALADHHRDRLLEAERAHRAVDAARAEASLRAHDRGRHTSILRGEGALTLITDPPGAEVRLARFVLRDRRLVPEDMGLLGTTPLRAAALPKGSYLLRVRAPGRAEVLYPVLIERAAHWDGCPPGEAEPLPIVLPTEDELGPDDVYVPAGYAWTGGDPQAADALPARRIWIDGFIVSRFPVTNDAYRIFLDDLVRSGREADAIAACPRAQLGMSGQRAVFERDREGRFVLGVDDLERPLLPDAPVTLIDWFGATAYAAWAGARRGVPFRLLDELEREKAARGVDGRLCPTGNHLDARFFRVAESVETRPSAVGVHESPLDVSPYGVRGLGGNTRDYCGNAWRREGPRIEGGRLVREEARGDEVRAVRGGAWSSALEWCRSAARMGNAPGIRRFTTGIRLGRSYPAGSPGGQ
ncbi:serine/threonine protein kinase [Minicystis rosea]|nr:serine/threonine protein kinase [Minicystis rosea]